MAIGNRKSLGFAFTEVLFAVMILGLGFILLAAMFPFAIKQNQLTREEIMGTQVVHNGSQFIRAQVTDELFPSTARNDTPAAVVVPMVGPRWDAFNRAFVSPTDPQVAWIGFYKRPNNSPQIEAILVAVGSRGRNPYGTSAAEVTRVSDSNSPPTATTNMTPGQVNVLELDLDVGQREGDWVKITDPASPAYGRVAYLAKQNPADPTEFELAPVDDFAGFPYHTRENNLNEYFAVSGATAEILRPAILRPQQAWVALTESGQDHLPDLLTFYFPDSSASNGYRQATDAEVPGAVEDAVVIIADDMVDDDLDGTSVNDIGRANGRTYRLGKRRSDLGDGVWELAPGYDMKLLDRGTVSDDGLHNPSSDDDLTENLPVRDVNVPLSVMPADWHPARAFVVGRLPLTAGGTPEGLSQAIMVYRVTLPVRIDQ